MASTLNADALVLVTLTSPPPLIVISSSVPSLSVKRIIGLLSLPVVDCTTLVVYVVLSLAPALGIVSVLTLTAVIWPLAFDVTLSITSNVPAYDKLSLAVVSDLVISEWSIVIVSASA